jgi:nucleoid-associated protein YgaU
MAVSLLSFDREAGADLLAARPVQPDGETPLAAAATLCRAIEDHLDQLGLHAEQLEVTYDSTRALLRVSGCAVSQDARERILLCCGNVRGVAAVDDRMTVLMPSEVSRWRFVQPGDTLARIADDLYRDARREHQLRAANQPLIGDTDELQPGWLLRVPT